MSNLVGTSVSWLTSSGIIYLPEVLLVSNTQPLPFLTSKFWQPPDLLSNIGMAEDGGSINLLRVQTSNVEAFSVSRFILLWLMIVFLSLTAHVIALPPFLFELNFTRYSRFTLPPAAVLSRRYNAA